MQDTKSITFAFYNGLGDFISELPLMEWFYQNDYKVEVIVYSWLKDFASFLAPFAHVTTIASTKDIIFIVPKTKTFFLSPSYILKFSYSKTSSVSYLLKKFIFTIKTQKCISSTVKDVLFYAFDLKKNYLDEHFFDMSYKLLQKNYDIHLKNFNHDIKINHENLYLFPFSGDSIKDYPLEKFYEVLEFFDKKYNITIFIQEKDTYKLSKKFNKFSILSISLQEITKYLDAKSIVLSNDSGPAHLATFLGSSVVSLFGITNAKKYMPKGKGKVVALQGSDKKVSNISVKEVLEAINSL